MNYLYVWLLVVRQGESLVITVRGKEFLKYLVQHGRTFSMTGR